MKPTCWTKEGTEIKGRVVTFQGDLVSEPWQSYENSRFSQPLRGDVPRE